MRTAKTLIRLGGCPGWSESSLDAQAILLVLSCRGSYLGRLSCESMHSGYVAHHNDPKILDRQVLANNADPECSWRNSLIQDQSDQGLHCLSFHLHYSIVQPPYSIFRVVTEYFFECPNVYRCLNSVIFTDHKIFRKGPISHPKKYTYHNCLSFFEAL